MFLGGLGACAIGGLAAASTRRGRQLLHRVLDADESPSAAGDLVETSVTQRGRRYAWTSKKAPRAVLLCLHGRGENERFTFETMRVPDFAHERGLEVAVLAVEGGSRSYWHARHGGVDPLREIISEVLPRFAGPPVFVLGWSMGGYGALLAAIEHPSVFAGVIASSAALAGSARESPREAFDDEADFAAHDVWGKRGQLTLPVRIDCGEDDPFAAANRRLLGQLPHAEGAVRPGFHDARFWRGALPQQLRFIERVLAGR